MPTTLVWFRRDLRVADLPTLRRAAGRGRVVCLFVLDPEILGRRHHRAPARLRFLRQGLEELDRELRERGGGLVVRRGDPVDVVPGLAAEAGADLVLWSRERSPLATARDARVAGALEGARIDHEAMEGDLLVAPEDMEGSKGHGYLVFTPFWKTWRGHAPREHVPAPDAISSPGGAPEPVLDDLPGGDPPVPAGPEAARLRIVELVRGGIADGYDERRDDLAADATSHLSAYLRLGMCTPGQIGRALGLPGSLSAGREAFWRQICWREFYHHHLARHPEVAHVALRPELRAIAWEGGDEDLVAWTRGETGYPLVDAAMRQLAEDGWIHNRGRLVAASFLVKDLLVDWRRGETVFMQGLVDGDPANNNGGWQWTAGTGTDAAPYFRVMSPIRQAERFDPDGDYVRRWVPELRDVPTRRIHEPWRMSPEEQGAAGCRIGSDYPEPRVDHKARRRRVLELYERARESAPDRDGSGG
jgi:deoxyribodipyrimidine photo-lyase